MKTKDQVIAAIDQSTEALRALARIDYDNPRQTDANVRAAVELLRAAASILCDGRNQ